MACTADEMEEGRRLLMGFDASFVPDGVVGHARGALGAVRCDQRFTEKASTGCLCHADGVGKC